MLVLHSALLLTLLWAIGPNNLLAQPFKMEMIQNPHPTEQIFFINLKLSKTAEY